MSPFCDYLMCGPRQLFFQCGTEMPEVVHPGGHGYVTYSWIMKLEENSFGMLLGNIYLPKRKREKVKKNPVSCILST